ncbi:UNVERIFIED_CONTAM: hypothetical protein FKN15_062231 [Acipenser sinensis]
MILSRSHWTRPHRARTRPQPTLAEHREFSPKSGHSGADAKAVNHPSMATGEARAHIQGLWTNNDPKSEPLDASTQSTDASTTNSGRAPGIQPQVWAFRARTRPQPTLAEHREFSPKSGHSGADAKAVNHPSMATGEAHTHIAQKKNLIPGLQRKPSPHKYSAKALDFLPERESGSAWLTKLNSDHPSPRYFYREKATDPALKVALPKGRPFAVSRCIRMTTSHSHDCGVDFQVHLNQAIDSIRKASTTVNHWQNLYFYKYSPSVLSVDKSSALLREIKEGRADAVIQVRDTAGEENPKQAYRKEENRDAKFVEGRRKQLQSYLRSVMNKVIQTLPEFTASPTKENLLQLLPFCM